MTFSLRPLRLFAAASLALALAASAAADAPARLPGPFKADALSFFIVHQGGDLEATLEVEAPGPTLGIGWNRRVRAAVFATFYDSEQRRVGERFHRFEEGGPLTAELAFALEDAEPGIYQLRYTSGGSSHGNRELDFDLSTNPPAAFGVQSRRARLAQAVDGQFSEVFLYVPPGAESFRPELTAGSGKLYDERGALLSEFTHRDSPPVNVERGGAVWRMEIDMPTHVHRWLGNSGDFDAVLCPDEDTARAIRGGSFAAQDGSLFPHRSQADMHDWLSRLRPEAIEVPGLADLDLDAMEEALAAEPRNRHLFSPWGTFAHLPNLLAQQTLDEPWGGQSARSAALTLAAAYSIDEPFNPYYRHQGILNRLLLSEFHRYLRLRQNDTLRDGMRIMSAHDPFSGDRTPFGMAGAMVEDEGLRRLWLEGARRHVERFAFHRTSCENQSAHIPNNLYALYMGSGEGIYRDLAANWMANTLDPDLNSHLRAGYLMEAYGPDATYQGLAANMLAWNYHWSGDAGVKEAYRFIVDTFNHTVAPEPDGSVHGSANFSHRTPGSWAQRQYRGGTLSMSQYVEEAAAWHQGLDPDDPEYRERAAEYIRDEFRTYWRRGPREPIRRASEYRYVTQYMHFPETVIQGAQLPMVASERFERDIGGQFIAVRRPAYYALAYVGRPAPDVARIRNRDVREGLQRRTGGGLSVFWTPGFGSAVLSQNWHAHANQMPRADLPGGEADYPDYYTVEHEFDADAGTLVATSRMIHLPIRISRSMDFHDDALRVAVEFRFEADVEVEQLVEQIPFPWFDKVVLDEDAPNVHSRVDGAWRAAPPDGAVEAVRLVHKETGAAVAVEFPDPTPVRLGERVVGTVYPARPGVARQVAGRSTGLLEIHLGSRFREGQTVSLSYALVPQNAE